jgi:RNA polymerase sigma factor (sigma-70 family)
MRMKTSDEALAQQAADGDRNAFAVLLERRYDGLFRLAFRLTGSQHEAEDLTQDICAALPAKLGNYRADARFSTWLYRVAINAAHDRRRRAVTHARAADGWGDWELNRQAVNTEIAEKTDWLTTTMTTLPIDLRDTLALLLDDELTHAQAGEILGISEGTISWRMSEAKKRLREIAQQEAAT